MSDEKRLEALTEEIKLLKGEIKNSLTSVRDYLLNMELPSSEFSTILAALSGDNSGQKLSLDGALGNDAKKEETVAEEPEEVTDDIAQPPPDENLIDTEQPEDLLDDIPEETPLVGEELQDPPEEQEEQMEPEDTLEPEEIVEEAQDMEQPEETDETEPAEAQLEPETDEEIEDTDEPEEEAEETMELPEEEFDDSGLEPDASAEEEQPMELERTTADVSQGTPKVNMLANLINWVAKAKKEIGDELLPTFLDVYGVSGHLSLELKDVILHLAERTKEKTEPCTDAEVWSEAMLSLHGILTGGDAPLNPAIPLWKEALDGNTLGENEMDEEIIEVDKQEKPVKLKFVFPTANGKEKEYCLDLTPDTGDDNE